MEPGAQGPALRGRGGLEGGRGRAGREVGAAARLAGGQGERGARVDPRLRRRGPAGHLGRAPDHHAAAGRLHARGSTTRSWAGRSSPRSGREAWSVEPSPPSRLRLGRHPDGLRGDDRRLHPGGDPGAGAGGAARGDDPRHDRARPARDDRVLVPGCDDALFETDHRDLPAALATTFRDTPVLFAGVETMLRDLWRRRVTCWPWPRARAGGGWTFSLEQTGLRSLFHSTRTADEAFSKPHPQMLLDILDDLGVPPLRRADDRGHDLRPGDGEERGHRRRSASAPARTAGRSSSGSSRSPAWRGWWSCRPGGRDGPRSLRPAPALVSFPQCD